LKDVTDPPAPATLSRCLDNSGPAAGAAPGLVAASPSTAHPDYFYTWTRDSALTFATILDRFLPSSALDGGGFHAHQRPSPSSLTSRDEPELESLLREYVSSQTLLQRVPNPSGGLLDGGLGEPKFTALGAAFEGSWGRPQRVRPLFGLRDVCPPT
jgi:glucoamylase